MNRTAEAEQKQLLVMQWPNCGYKRDQERSWNRKNKRAIKSWIEEFIKFNSSWAGINSLSLSFNHYRPCKKVWDSAEVTPMSYKPLLMEM